MSPGAHTLARWLRDRRRATPERVAIRCDDEVTTYARLDRRSELLASALLARGLRRGDRVATLTANSPEHVELLFACAKAGLVLLPLNWRLTAGELAYQLVDAEPALVFVEPGREAPAEPTVERVELSRGTLDALGAGAGDAAGTVVDDADPLLLVYTSGTTGRPKGAVLTHANCFWTNLSLDRTLPLGGSDVVLAVLPQFHVGGWNVQPLLAWWVGATVVLAREFDPARALALVAEQRVTTMMGVPATYQFMAQDPAFADADLSSLRVAVVGGAPIPEALLRTWHERGVAMVQGYGLTEAAPNVLCLPAEDAERKRGWAGRPYAHVDVALRDPASGRLLDGAACGELVVRGPNVFAGYWRDPTATERAFADGWLLTGDVAERDEQGNHRIIDRIKDMYVSGGENVYPAEVEAALAEHGAVADAAVVGVTDGRWGEVGVAFVAPARDARPSEAELLAHMRAALAGFKVPRSVRIVDELPRSAVGKVLKDELRRRAQS